MGTVPVVELNGRLLTQSYAILRHFARVLGKYEGEGEEERFWVDAVCDVCIDCKFCSSLLPNCEMRGFVGCDDRGVGWGWVLSSDVEI